MKHGWIIVIFCSLTVWLPTLAAAEQSPARILVIKSSDNAYFNQTIEILQQQVADTTEFDIRLARDLDSGPGDSDSKSLVIALGQAAVTAVQNSAQRPDAINAYLTHEQFRQLDLGEQTTILLDQPLKRYLAFSKLLLKLESVGVITPGDAESDSAQTGLLLRLDLRLDRYRVDPQNKLLPVLRRLLRQSDALLMLPRQAIYNRDSLKGVLLTSYRDRKPVISYSPAHVKAGALASIYSSPADIGRHLALLVNRRLQNSQSKPPVFVYARYYSITTNRRVARALGIDLPDEHKLRARMDELVP